MQLITDHPTRTTYNSGYLDTLYGSKDNSLDIKKNNSNPVFIKGNSNLKLLLGYFIFTFHTLICLFIWGIPFITNNVYILLALIIVYIFIVIQWYISGECYFNKIENLLLSGDYSTNENGKEKSMYITLIGKYFGELNVYLFLCFLPGIITIYSVFKITMILKKKIPFELKVYDKSL